MSTYALDLAPLAFDPRRGVARALRGLLLGLGRAGAGGARLLGLVVRRGGAPLEPGLEGAPALADLEVLDLPADAPARRARAALWARAAARGADAVLSPWTALPAVELPAGDLPAAVQVHEVPAARQGALEGRLRAWRHARALAHAVERARVLVCPAQAVREDLLRLHPAAAARCTVIAHAFDPAPWRAAAERAADGVAPYVLLVGTGAGAGGLRKKGVDVLLEAFAGGRLGGLGLQVVGALRGAPAHVTVHEGLSDADLAPLVAAARVLVVPSRSEGFGFPLLEGFAAGVPVVASAAGALPEVSGGAALLVPPGDAAALAQALARAHADPGLRAALRAAGRARAEAFPPEAAARAWLDALARAAGAA